MKKILLILGVLFTFGLWINTSVALAGTYGSGTYNGGVYGNGSSATTTSNSSSGSSDSTPSKPGCLDAKPGGKAPWLYGAIATGSTTIDLYFTSADKPIDHYALEYGTESGKYKYGSDNIGGSDSRIYTVRSLTPGKTYYFKVRGGNGCATGEWSNEISATTRSLTASKQLDITPELIIVSPTPSPTLKPSKSGINLSPTPSPVAINSYELRVVVQNTKKEPVKNADVTLHSDPRMGKTDDKGEVVFSNVEGGEHRVLVAYDDYKGEQSLYLTGNTRTIDLRITVEPKTSTFSKLSLIIIGFLTVGLVILLIMIFKSKKHDTL